MFTNPANLATTDDPKVLVPGDPAQVMETARVCRVYAEKFDAIGNELKRSERTVWEGSAAEAFRERYNGVPAKWFNVSDIFGEKAAPAFEAHAHTLEWSQREAREAVALWKEGVRRTQEAGASNPILLTSLADDSTLSLLGVQPKMRVTGDPGAELRARARAQLDRARAELADSGDRAARTLRKALDEAPVKPSWFTDLLIAADAYLQYLGGGGNASHSTVRNYRWPTMSLADFGFHPSGFSEGSHPVSGQQASFTPTDLQGKLVVGQLTFNLSGELTVRGSHWEFVGEAVPEVDVYDFEPKGRPFVAEALTTAGRVVGEVAELESLGLVRPKAYTRELSGAIPIYESGAF